MKRFLLAFAVVWWSAVAWAVRYVKNPDGTISSIEDFARRDIDAKKAFIESLIRDKEYEIARLHDNIESLQAQIGLFQAELDALVLADR